MAPFLAPKSADEVDSDTMPAQPAASHTGTATILFTDLVGSTAQRPSSRRSKGTTLLVRTGAPDAEVEATFAGALVVARRQGAKGAALRAATRYARWLRDYGRAAEGRELLAPLYAWFTEGFDTANLIEAMALLAGLA